MNNNIIPVINRLMNLVPPPIIRLRYVLSNVENPKKLQIELQQNHIENKEIGGSSQNFVQTHQNPIEIEQKNDANEATQNLIESSQNQENNIENQICYETLQDFHKNPQNEQNNSSQKSSDTDEDHQNADFESNSDYEIISSYIISEEQIYSDSEKKLLKL